uniref:B30.2/SPRY domain-containing protein n=1 Tax=Falco tinnunculus TaxID=100819 RepID=A0A8C4URQ0_FALTI
MVPTSPAITSPISKGKRFASRWEMGSARRMTETFLDLERTLHVISRQNSVLRETLGRFQGTVEHGWADGGYAPIMGRGMFVTLDPDTANAQLVLSRDRRGVRWTDAGQDLPTTPQRFDISSCVLGCQGFTMGRHCWEVEVAGGRTWALGVAQRSVSRKGWLEFQPEKGIWVMGRCGSQYRVFTSPITTFPATGKTGRVWVTLDCGEGKVAFYLAKHEPPIFTFQQVSFGGESIFPFFWVGRGSHLPVLLTRAHLCLHSGEP